MTRLRQRKPARSTREELARLREDLRGLRALMLGENGQGGQMRAFTETLARLETELKEQRAFRHTFIEMVPKLLERVNTMGEVAAEMRGAAPMKVLALRSKRVVMPGGREIEVPAIVEE